MNTCEKWGHVYIVFGTSLVEAARYYSSFLTKRIARGRSKDFSLGWAQIPFSEFR